MEFREVKLQEVWQATRPGEPIPENVVRLKSWEGVVEAHSIGHCTGDSVTGEIVSLSVAPAYQRAGIGRRLLSLVVNALRVAGANRIWVEAPSDPQVPAYRFYRALGWRPTGERAPDGSDILELHSD